MPAMKGSVRSVALAVAWLAIVALLSLGAAGIVAAMAHQPGTPGRAELTYLGDAAIEPGLAAAEDSLAKLSDEVAALGELGRSAIGDLVGGNLDSLATTVSDGEGLALSIQTHTSQIRTALENLPGIGSQSELVLSSDVRRRHALALTALKSTNGIALAWTRLGAGALAATRVTTLLLDHDKTTGEAAAAGRNAKYKSAIAKLTQSDALIAQARALRDSLAATGIDVSTLTQWLDLNASYDAILRRLYQGFIDSKGRITNEIRQAVKDELVARARLPADTKGLVVILAEIGRGGLNEAVIGIEEARGELEAALGLLSAPADAGSDGASPAP
jgi:hypothetical protein